MLAGNCTPLIVRSRVFDFDPPRSKYMKSVKKPQRPFCASKVPMKANLRESMIVSELTLMLVPPSRAGNLDLPPISGK